MTIVLKNFAIAGYRSFGKHPQYFDRLSKVNLLIGRNNAGKSNVIRFLIDIYPKGPGPYPFENNPLNKHLPDYPELLVGFGEEIIDASRLREDHPVLKQFSHNTQHDKAKSDFIKLYLEKQKLDNTELVWTFVAPESRTAKLETWKEAIKSLGNYDIENLWRALTGYNGGDRQNSWEPDILNKVYPDCANIKCALIPALLHKSGINSML